MNIELQIQNAENSNDSLMDELKQQLDKIAEKQNKIDNTIAKIEGVLN